MDSSAVVAGITGSSLLVTGGGTGIGRAVALAAARHGARVTISGRRRDVLDDTARCAAADGLDVHAEVADVTDSASVDDLVASVAARQGGLDGVVNAAGVARFGPSEDVTDEDFLHVIDVNLVGAFRVSRAAGRVMLPAGRGSIVHIGSLTSLGGFAGRTAYGVSKHGVIGLTRTLAAEWGATGVRVNAVAPGFVRTPMTDRAISRGVLNLDDIERRTPLARRAEPEEMTGPVLFLLSDTASFVNGDCLVADGGWTASVGPPTGFADARPLPAS
ncbi:SDR family NAD(P)-dependent oxidoreductase [Sphaerisporangium aureirubrum]|uniref:SDR family NAD(P)-dependent oxidoreductase n=1 Tax=Sphaerisporangium aureirubrum TaxID=1544736 RepID=A0ABW1NLN6_9ACTN